ncbi:ammonium transporter [bacterium]|nr:MAG: ammonium transporter [bacterium]
MVQHLRARLLALGSFTLLSAVASAQDTAAATAPAMDKADEAWMIVATALVLLMTPALALFYGGMVHKKNVLNTMLMSFLMMGVMSILWVFVGYSIAFGKTDNGFFGNPMEFFMGKGISTSESYPYAAMTIPNALFCLFQMKFAIITPALISGAIAERVRFRGYLILTVLWSLLIYCPLACWVWNPNGWLCKLGALDFAGGTVVHLASGISALALVMVLGKRKNLTPPPNNITLTLLGGGLLWVGWFGFNAGSALSIGDLAVNAFLTTHLAAAAGMLAWLLAEKLKSGKMTAIGGASGLVAGLVGITPAAGFVDIGGSVVIGLVVGVVCYLGIQLKHKAGYDDALDVVGVHGIGGLTGAILTGALATTAVNNAITKGALENGRMALILKQLTACGATIAFAFIGTYALSLLVSKTIGLRTSEETEDRGLDEVVHGESGYGFEDPTGRPLTHA